ncbi:glycosyltransferase [Geodermatophilus sp. URMC 62]|uniref:glycosyltransferase n=1 Tax=Geodermatophilus sp. URMC 62 TaxID=3423414 RepID=UPI00406D35DC
MTRVAVVHEAWHGPGGPDGVVEQLCAAWPGAQLLTTGVAGERAPARPGPARLGAVVLRSRDHGDGRLPGVLGAVPPAVSPVDLSDLDLVLTVHRAVAHRVLPQDDAPVVSYVHSPARWIWDPRFRRALPAGRVGRLALDHRALRQQGPDRAAAQRPDVLLAPSRAVAERISRWWDRTAEVVPPPVDVDWFRPAPRAREDFFLYAGGLCPSESPDVAVAAARVAGVRLVVAGDGPARPVLERMAGRRVDVVGEVGREELRELYRRCAAVVVPGEEDVGRAAVEAQACGTPVLALAAGGALETVVDGISGRLWRPLYDGTAVGSLAHELRRFDPGAYDPARLRRHAEGFAPRRFRRSVQLVVRELLARGGNPQRQVTGRGSGLRQAATC